MGLKETKVQVVANPGRHKQASFADAVRNKQLMEAVEVSALFHASLASLLSESSRCVRSGFLVK